MTQHDQEALDHIEFLESQLIVAEVENDIKDKRIEELNQKIIDLETAVQMMVTDRTYCP